MCSSDLEFAVVDLTCQREFMVDGVGARGDVLSVDAAHEVPATAHDEDIEHCSARCGVGETCIQVVPAADERSVSRQKPDSERADSDGSGAVRRGVVSPRSGCHDDAG